MAHSHKGLYSWYNETLKKAFYWEEKELLDNQRYTLAHKCINIESDRTISKKQMLKGPSKSLVKRIHSLKPTENEK